MSAYIVNRATMLAAVHAIAKYCTTFGGMALPADIRTPEAVAMLTDLGRRLFEMNREAVRQRYGDADDVPVFTFDPHRRPTTAQMKGSVQCLGYQCSEGNVPATDVFKALEAAEAEIVRQINVDGEWGVMSDADIPVSPDAALLSAADPELSRRLARLDPGTASPTAVPASPKYGR